MDKELVSVIIPAFNVAADIRQTLNSVLAQTYQAIEVIVVDDGSSDATAAIVEEFGTRDARIQLIRQTNAGVGAARNAAIRKARGKYVATLDADDLWFPEKLEKQVACIEQCGNETGLVYCWSQLISEDGELVDMSQFNTLEGRLRHAMVLQNLLGNASVPLFRAAALEKVGLYLTRAEQKGAQGCEDWDLYLRIAEIFSIRVVRFNFGRSIQARSYEPMRYRLGETEVTRPLGPGPLEFRPDENGAALLIRRNGRPIGFLMRENSGKLTWTPEELNHWIGDALKTKIVEEAIRDELAPPRRNISFPSLSVAICTRDRVATLKRCLDSLLPLQQKYGFELLVIDNAPSDDTTAKLVKRSSPARYILEQRPGLDFARNRAWMEATGDLIAYLDDDVVVDSGWVAGLQEAWDENSDAAAFTGLVMPLRLDTTAQVLFEKRNGFQRGFDKNRFGREMPGNSLYPCGAGIFGAGCNMAFRRDVLRDIGGFDEALDTGAPLPGGGDLDIFYRIIRAGHMLVYEPSYMVFHEHRASESGLRHQYYTWGLGFMAFVEKSYRNDPSQRARFRRLVIWWIGDQISQLWQTLRGKHVLPFSMIFAEFCGGLVGIFGEYPRSLKRIATIRRDFA